MSRPDGAVTLLTDGEMRALGFTDRREGYWYWSRNVDKYTSLNFTIDKLTGLYEELVMDEMFGQPDPYGQAKPEYRDAIIKKIDDYVKAFNDVGLDLNVDHREYGCV